MAKNPIVQVLKRAKEKADKLVLELDPELARELVRDLERAWELELELHLAWELELDLARLLPRARFLARDLAQARKWTLVWGLARVRLRTQARELARELMLPSEDKVQPLHPVQDIEITIEVPKGASPEKVMEIVKQAALRADAVHRANGGQGLKVDSIDVFGECRVPAGVNR